MRVFVDASLIIYLNAKLPREEAEKVEKFWLELLKEELYTDVLALDEAIYVSKRKYGIDVESTLELIDRAILPYVDILPLGLEEYLKAKEYMVKYRLKPSDALHLAVMDSNGLQVIATEDKDFDRTHVKRIWIEYAVEYGSKVSSL